jgi:hypothetical protein
MRRRAARIIFDSLVMSPDPEDRYAVTNALLDVAQFDIWAVPYDIPRRNLDAGLAKGRLRRSGTGSNIQLLSYPLVAERLSRDDDELVAAKAREVLRAIAGRPKEGRDPSVRSGSN